MVTVRCLAVRIKREDAENTRRFLRDKNLLRKDLRIGRTGSFVFFPIINDANIGSEYDVEEHDFCYRFIRPGAYRDILDLPDDLMAFLPTSYDIVGSIILIKLPDELLKFKESIGLTLLKVHRSCTTVCRVDPVMGEFRVRDVEVIAGSKNTVTMHREYGLWLKVDVAKVYFSGRLASERRRVAGLVCKNEIIVDMFTGVGPFAIMMARFGSPKRVVAIDKNMDAVGCARFNSVRNDVSDVVEVVHGDASEVRDILGDMEVDRVVMNLPFGGFGFFSDALSVAGNRCVIHYYEVLAEDAIKHREDELQKCAAEHGFVLTFSRVSKIKSYAPYEFYMGFDIVAQKCADVA